MEVGEEDFDAAAGGEELGDFDYGDEVAAVRATGCCGAPVDFEWSFFFQDYIVDDFAIEDFGEVGFDQRN